MGNFGAAGMYCAERFFLVIQDAAINELASAPRIMSHLQGIPILNINCNIDKFVIPIGDGEESASFDA